MRDQLPYLVLLILLLSLAGFAWLTAHPDAAIVDRAQDWPIVGVFAQWFRATYPTAPPLDPARQDRVAPELEPGVRPMIWLEPGTRLHRDPDLGSPVDGLIRFTTNGVVAEQRGPWYFVRSARQGGGWAHLPDYREPDRPIFGSDPLPVGPLPGVPAATERVAEARKLLREGGREERLGPYRFLTDVEDELLVARCAELVSKAEAAYGDRYGLEVLDEPRETVVLFASEASYESFLAAEGPAASSGHTRGGLVTLRQEGRLREEVVATFAHELAHLFNRRALGPALPAWLEEGIAEDFSGRMSRPLVLEDRGGWWAAGPGAAPHLLREARAKGRAPGLEELAGGPSIGPPADPTERALFYSAAGLWIRFFVESDGEAWTSYLRGIAAGEPPSLERIEEVLGRDRRELQRAFRVWFEAAAS